MAESTKDVLHKTREMLDVAQRGLSDLIGADAARRPMGIYNVAVFGRSVTLVLQNMRSIDRAGFDAWYAPYANEMETDPLADYFKKLRNEILKQGAPSTGMSMHVEHVDSGEMQSLMADPPPGAKAFFIGDQLGGSGWEVELPDGTINKYYVQLPESLRVKVSLHLPDPPTEHAGEVLADTSITTLCRRYLQYLERVVADAEGHFGT
jgi:hypothetical protein